MGCLIGKVFINSSQQYPENQQNSSVIATTDTASKANTVAATEVVPSTVLSVTTPEPSAIEALEKEETNTVAAPVTAETQTNADATEKLSITSDSSLVDMYRTRVFGTSCE